MASIERAPQPDERQDERLSSDFHDRLARAFERERDAECEVAS